jgi:cation:H+ antiporter
MNTFWALLFLVAGLVVLWKCADWLVSGAVGLAERFNISPLVMGLTIVAMGTSAPEMAASIAAASRNAGNIAIGNIFGSNIANLALVGGLCALIRPIKVQSRALRREMPIMLISTVLLWPILFNEYLSRIEGYIFLALFVAAMVWTISSAAKNNTKQNTLLTNIDKIHKFRPLKIDIFLVVIGLAGLAIGADITLRGAVFIGGKIGLSDAVIGSTIIAIGTSLPELVTCVVASLKKHDDISIGNLVGSNIFNTLLVTGSAAVVKPFAVQNRFLGPDFAFLLAVSVAFFAFALFGKRRINRLCGTLLIFSYAGYMLYLLTHNS